MTSDISDFRRGSGFDFGLNSYPYTPVIYNPCECQERYSFKPESKLLDYLRQCKGWVDSDDGTYTLNYIIVVLLAFAKERGFLYTKKSLDKHLKGDAEFTKALDYPSSKIHVRYLRSFICNNHLNREKGGMLFFEAYPPFACPNKIGKVTRRLIYSITGVPLFLSMLISQYPWNEVVKPRLRKMLKQELQGANECLMF